MRPNDRIVTAEPYQARQCPECLQWIFTDAPPFGEDDPTKTERDFLHFEREHYEEWKTKQLDAFGRVFGIPYFNYNKDRILIAILEDVG